VLEELIEARHGGAIVAGDQLLLGADERLRRSFRRRRDGTIVGNG
jgi:hypothetical protein